VISLVPGGRLRGYLQIPLVPSLVWHRDGSRPSILIELPPRELAAEWDDREGHSFRCPSSLHSRFPMRELRSVRRRAGRALQSQWDRGVAAAHSAAAARRRLSELRGTVVVKPRRLRWVGERFAMDAPRDGVPVQP
jgi:hypothetical protein